MYVNTATHDTGISVVIVMLAIYLQILFRIKIVRTSMCHEYKKIHGYALFMDQPTELSPSLIASNNRLIQMTTMSQTVARPF
jgi:hypothetical protein